MQTTVALVEARPETILDDVRRVLELAGIDPAQLGAAPVLAAGRTAGGWFPGAGSTPWQLDGVLTSLGRAVPAGEDPVFLAADLDRGGLRNRLGGRAWENVLARHGARYVPVDDLDATPVPVGRAPALAAVLPKGIRYPLPLMNRPTCLLPVPRLVEGWPVAGAVALVSALLTGARIRSRRIPLAEIRAETMDMAREILGETSVLMDATCWGVVRRGFPGAVARNLLLAGRDPVAVDAVATRLAGFDPAMVPWLKLCGQRDVGVADLDRIRLRGSVELMNLDLGITDALIPAGSDRSVRQAARRWFWRRFRRPRLVREHRLTAWGRLHEEYRTSQRGIETE